MSRTKVRKHYLLLALNLAVSLAIMYFVMFAMIWTLRDFFHNLNMFYMALMMWAPMGSLMLVTMGMMYPQKRLNLILHAAFAIVFAVSFWAIRDQGLIGDRQFLRSMIPHHSGAVLMCRDASITDPEIRVLCERAIVPAQQREIEQMKAIMERL